MSASNFCHDYFFLCHLHHPQECWEWGIFTLWGQKAVNTLTLHRDVLTSGGNKFVKHRTSHIICAQSVLAPLEWMASKTCLILTFCESSF